MERFPSPLLTLFTLLIALPGVSQALLSSVVIRFGGRFEERAQGLAVDAAGNIFITGHTMSDNLPCVGTLNPNHHNPMSSHQHDQWQYSDGCVAKLSPDGSTVLWCTYVGGTDQDRAYNLKVDATGVFVAGHSESSDLVSLSPSPAMAATMYQSTFGDINGGSDGDNASVNHGLGLDALGHPVVIAW
jgi:hypothetical protein